MPWDKKTKFAGLLGVLGLSYVLHRTKDEQDFQSIDGLNLDIKPDLLIENGVKKLNISDKERQIVERLGKVAVGKLLSGGNNDRQD